MKQLREYLFIFLDLYIYVISFIVILYNNIIDNMKNEFIVLKYL